MVHIPILDGKKNYPTTGSTWIWKGGHTHANWLFTEAGTYKMKVKVVGKKGGKDVESREYTYTWEAGKRFIKSLIQSRRVH